MKIVWIFFKDLKQYCTFSTRECKIFQQTQLHYKFVFNSRCFIHLVYFITNRLMNKEKSKEHK